MAGRKNGLGRGLDAFFPDRTSVVKEPARKTITKTVKTEKKSDVAEKQTNPTVAKKQTADSKTGAMIVKISSVEPNMDQPRKQFDEDALMELSESIKQYGVLHPLLVSDKKDYYEIIAGERRWRAAKLAGLTEIPVIVKEFSEQELVEISLIENIQREDLNPVEEAMAYKRLIDEFHLKQDEIAERVGKSRTAVTNAMRLLKLSEKVQQMLIDEMITAGHARAILSIADKEKQESIAMKVFDEKLSVRETEALVKRMLEPPKTAKKSKFSSAEDAIYESLEEKMKNADVVVTGEGRLDAQTVMGKAPVGVAALAKKYNAKVIAFAGSVAPEASVCNQAGIDAFFPIVRGVTTLEEAMKKENAMWRCTINRKTSPLNSPYTEITDEWLRETPTKTNLKNALVADIDADGIIYKSIMEYVQLLNEKSADITLPLASVCSCKVTARVKAQNSIEFKIQNYKTERHEFGKIPINKCINDLFGIRIFLREPLTFDEVYSFIEDTYPNRYRCIDSSKFDYKAVHLYFKENNQSFPWELQIWNMCDMDSNFSSHKKYKQEYTAWEKESKEGGIIND